MELILDRPFCGDKPALFTAETDKAYGVTLTQSDISKE